MEWRKWSGASGNRIKAFAGLFLSFHCDRKTKTRNKRKNDNSAFTSLPTMEKFGRTVDLDLRYSICTVSHTTVQHASNIYCNMNAKLYSTLLHQVKESKAACSVQLSEAAVGASRECPDIERACRT